MASGWASVMHRKTAAMSNEGIAMIRVRHRHSISRLMAGRNAVYQSRVSPVVRRGGRSSMIQSQVR
jgi:hypothetical protein